MAANRPAQTSRRARFIACAAIALVVGALSLAIENVAVERYFPELSRVTQDFSAAYLRRELRRLATAPPQTIFLGDSLMWGWGVKDQETAVAVLAANGCACRNLAFTLGSPTNEYALVRMLQHENVHPKAVVIEVNQVLFKPTVLNYANLRDQVYDVTKDVLTPEDLQLFHEPRRGWRRKVDRFFDSLSAAYAFHSDAREGVLVGEPEEEPRNPSFERLYSYAPLSERNVGVHYLERTVDLLRAAGTPVYAFFTPTSRRAFGSKTDDPRFVANAAFLQRMLEARGVRVLRVESKFADDEFYDNIHLNRIGHRKLAAYLARFLNAPAVATR